MEGLFSDWLLKAVMFFWFLWGQFKKAGERGKSGDSNLIPSMLYYKVILMCRNYQNWTTWYTIHKCCQPVHQNQASWAFICNSVGVWSPCASSSRFSEPRPRLPPHSSGLHVFRWEQWEVLSLSDVRCQQVEVVSEGVRVRTAGAPAQQACWEWAGSRPAQPALIPKGLMVHLQDHFLHFPLPAISRRCLTD